MNEQIQTETTSGLATIQVDVETRDLLRAIAKRNMRSIKSHLLWLARREYVSEFGELPPALPLEKDNGHEES